MATRTDAAQLRLLACQIADSDQMRAAVDAAPCKPSRNCDSAQTYDFAALFPPSGLDRAKPVTPRVAYLLHAGAELAFEELIDAAGQGWDEMLVDMLPPVALAWLETCRDDRRLVWLARFAAGLAWVRNAVVLGVIPVPRCHGEEMALHVAIDAAEDIAELSDDDLDLAALPASDWDASFDCLHSTLFEDNRVIDLFYRDAEGLPEGHEKSGSGEPAGTVEAGLHPADWFLPFDPAGDDDLV